MTEKFPSSPHPLISSSPLRIGIDLDNTIIHYDDAFVIAARGRGLVQAGFSGTKQELRDHIRTLPEGETHWQKLQGYVYGKGIAHAKIFDGVKEFIHAAQQKNHELFIVSHKTELGHFDDDKVNLREAALGFLKAQGIALPVSFHATRQEKVERIAALALDWFIDDLVEVYEEKHFPVATKQILFHTAPGKPPQGSWKACADWNAIKTLIAA